MIEYWKKMESIFTKERARMNITFHLGDKQTSARVVKTLAANRKELSVCREAIASFK